ncbi:DNA replication factor GINS [Natrialba magadii ATCC 43099]|uniref:DNA replication factor GINS n=1 Tax=Natrialba magadii (strain ATCC 43099 / DSM 3394 / CCM 3739 / CIP 104546 / IAM 13178 / JCM 8861 / NBRC 102185 / NCIMB 2190 / MS3) TaxID=547559 RepID=D3SXV7_NATMM|nr:hypothetical protein [Natrialba magadii]ADD03997.1 DNA replication factor GINS [Natrialba magadii ATCC 43099]ELY33154.1 hypothetical protein C500_02459 [Natrialba magadii ATCC 43099]
MNLNELRSVQSKERKKDSLQNLRPSFYQEVGEYIAELEDERERVADRVDDPFSSPEVGRLTDEIETAKDVVEAIYERRMGKLVKQASLAAAGMAANDDGLTAEEADLFDDLVERISSNKSRVLDVLEGVDDGADERSRIDTSSDDPTSDSLAASAADQNPRSDSREQAGDEISPHETDPAPEPPSPEPGAAAEPEPEPEPEPPTPPAESPAETAESDGMAAGTTETDTVSPADVMGGADSLGNADSLGDADAPSAGAPADPPEPPADSSTPPAPGPEATDEGGDAETGAPDSDRNTETLAVDRVTVKITEDVGNILGVDDREYTLASDDVVTLPEANATPLVEREAAEQLE